MAHSVQQRGQELTLGRDVELVHVERVVQAAHGVAHRGSVEDDAGAREREEVVQLPVTVHLALRLVDSAAQARSRSEGQREVRAGGTGEDVPLPALGGGDHWQHLCDVLCAGGAALLD